jgi:hypothetical protein
MMEFISNKNYMFRTVHWPSSGFNKFQHTTYFICPILAVISCGLGYVIQAKARSHAIYRRVHMSHSMVAMLISCDTCNEFSSYQKSRVNYGKRLQTRGKF